MIKFMQQEALFPSSNQCWSSLDFQNPFRTQTAEVKQWDGVRWDFPLVPPHPTTAEWFYHIIANLNSVRCSANHTLHANVKTVLPQEWSLLRYGAGRSWFAVFWTDPKQYSERFTDSGRAGGVSFLLLPDSQLLLYCPVGDIFRFRKPTGS